MKNSIEERLIDLETVVTHQQKMLTELNEVIIQLHQRLDVIPRELARLDGELRAQRELSPEIRRLEDEVPPHY
jgi:uncharacterized coiled-coil protein SlyX